MNGTTKTFMLLAALTALFMGIGYLIGGTSGAVIAFALAAAMNAFAYWNSDKMVLRMHDAREVDERSAPELVRIVRDLSARAGMPMPKVYLVDAPYPNAFATGRDPAHAAVAATTGLLQMLTRDEVEGVMAHELAHVRNRDTLIMTVTATFAGAISMLANFAFLFGGRDGEGRPANPLAMIALMLVAPLAAALVQMAISRTREYAADRGGAEISGKPQALASALAKLAQGAQAVPNPVAERNPAAAHLYIVHPSFGGRMDNLFSTHPDTGNRIAALQQIAGGSGQRFVAPERPSALSPVAPSVAKPSRVGSALDPLGAGAKRGPWS